MTAAPIRRIAISTGGGDAPGLNAVIRATVILAPAPDAANAAASATGAYSIASRWNSSSSATGRR